MSPETSNVPPQRLKFGEALRDLRKRAGLSGEALAAQIGASQPKVSRLERGRQVATLEDVTAWARATGASQDELAHLLEQLKDVGTELLQWKDATRRGIQQKQAEIQGLEATARSKRNFQPSLVPGLLQVPQYARRVLELFSVTAGMDAGALDAAVAKRMERQQRLYDPEYRFEFVMTEAALRWRPGPPGLILAQLDRIAVASTLPNVTIGIIPLDVEAPVIYGEAFGIYDDRDDEEDPIVTVELRTRELTISAPTEVARYIELFQRLRSTALTGDEGRAFLADLASRVRVLPD
jgi:transcriptional regulator with XRE-family HTH domain